MASKLKEQFSTVCRTRHLSLHTERQYWDWCRKMIAFCGIKTREDLLSGAEAKAAAFLAAEANRGVSASTHGQALNAIVFLYRDVLEKPLGVIPGLARPTRPARLPAVPATHQDAVDLVSSVQGRIGLVLRLLYGSALRVHDALRLRLHDLDFANNEIVIRSSKGDKDRVVPMPMALRCELKDLCDVREAEHMMDKRSGLGWVWLPGLFGKKNPRAHFETGWQYLFAAAGYSTDPVSGNKGRHHITAEAVQAAMRKARGRLKIRQRFTPHSLRHASAREMERRGNPLAAIQAQLGHSRIETTLRYLGAGKRIPKAISPLD